MLKKTSVFVAIIFTVTLIAAFSLWFYIALVCTGKIPALNFIPCTDIFNNNKKEPVSLVVKENATEGKLTVNDKNIFNDSAIKSNFYAQGVRDYEVKLVEEELDGYKFVRDNVVLATSKVEYEGKEKILISVHANDMLFSDTNDLNFWISFLVLRNLYFGTNSEDVGSGIKKHDTEIAALINEFKSTTGSYPFEYSENINNEN